MRRSIVPTVILGTFVFGLFLGRIGTRADMRGSGIFPDVPQNAYYDDAVGAMYEAGIITGYQDGRFGPDDPVTRGQVAVMMERFMNKAEGGGVGSRTSSVSSSSSSVRPGAGTISFSTTGFDISEGTAKATVNVTREGGSEGTVRVKYKTEDGSATAGEDYNGATGELTFSEGETSKSISINIIDDKIGEAAETFTIVLSEPTNGAVLGNNTVVTVRILDNDGGADDSGTSSSVGSIPNAGGFRFGGSAYAIPKSAGELTVVVERTGGSTGEVSVQYETVNEGTYSVATPGTDYSTTNGTLNFAAGETEKTFTVSIMDTETPGNKSFRLRLKSPTGGAVIASSTSNVTIVDDNVSGLTLGSGSLKFAEDEYTIAEGESGTVTVLRQLGTQGQVTVKLKSINGTAVSSDYVTIDTTLTFRAGESSKAVTVTTKSDNVADDNETFSLQLSEPSVAATIGEPSITVITIDE